MIYMYTRIGTRRRPSNLCVQRPTTSWLGCCKLLSAVLLQQLGESVRDQQRRVNETLHTVAEADFGFAVQLVGRLVDALFPADLVEFVNLRGGGGRKGIRNENTAIEVM